MRFNTPRISICQKCINLICGQSVDINILKKCLCEVIERNFPYPDDEQILSYVNREFSKKEGVFKNAALKIFSQDYKIKLQQEFDRVKGQELNKVDANRKQQFEEMINGDYLPTIEKTFVNRWQGRYGTSYQVDLEFWEKNFLKLYRACLLGILSSHGDKIKRPNEETWAILRKSVLLEDGRVCSKCSNCDNDTEYHMHHIIPLYEYGTNNKNNLVFLCQKCHQRQHEFKISKNIADKKSKPTKNAARIHQKIESRSHFMIP